MAETKTAWVVNTKKKLSKSEPRGRKVYKNYSFS